MFKLVSVLPGNGLYLNHIVFRTKDGLNKTYTCTCLGYAFCFQQHDSVTRQSYHFNPSSTYLRPNKNPITPDVTGFFFFHMFKQLLFFFGNSVYVYFRGHERWFTVFPINIINTTQKLKLCFILKKGQYFKDNTFLGFIKPYGRQVFPNKKEVKVLLLSRRVCFPVVF